MTTKIVVKAPGKDAPGFLRRTRQAVIFSEQLKSKNITVELFDEMVKFLLPFVVEPADRDVAADALLDASEEQFMQVMDALSGGGASGTVPLPNSKTSQPSTSPGSENAPTGQ